MDNIKKDIDKEPKDFYLKTDIEVIKGTLKAEGVNLNKESALIKTYVENLKKKFKK